MLGGEGDRVWRWKFWVGTTRFECFGFGGRGVVTRGSLLRLPSSVFMGCCVFGFRLLRPGLLSVGDHYRPVRSLRDQVRREIRIWVGGWNRGFLDTPQERRSSTLRSGPSARQRNVSRWVSQLQVGLRPHSFCRARGLAFQEPSSPRSTSHRYASSLCGFPCSHRTEALPAG